MSEHVGARAAASREVDPFEFETLRVASLEAGGAGELPEWEAFRALCDDMDMGQRRLDAIYRLHDLKLLDDCLNATPAGRDLLATVAR